MGVRSWEGEAVVYDAPPQPRLRPLMPAAMALALLLLLLLLCNGRPIESGDTRVNAHVAASLVQEADFDLDEYPELEAPFVTTAGGHRLSVYPILAPLFATPVFACVRAFVPLDETGSALGGKLAAALFSALASGALFLALALRRSRQSAGAPALLFGLATSVCSTSQALWQHPTAVFFLALALLFLTLAEGDESWAARAGLPLGLLAATRHADVVLAAVLVIGTGMRWPRRAPWLVAWTLPGVLLTLGYQAVCFGSPWRHGFSGAPGRFTELSGLGHAGLLLSPAKGLLVFTPVAVIAIVGLAAAWRRGERWLAGTLGAAAAAHWLLMGFWREWHGGESFGPRLLTDLLPLLFLFLPEGFELLPWLGRLLAALSLGVQALGAFAYDYRWERLHQRPAGGSSAELWNPAQSPIAFHVRQRVAILAAPDLRDGKAVVREHPVVLFGRKGSRVRFEGESVVLSGSEQTMQDVHLQRGARVDAARLQLRGRWDALFLRLPEPARARRLELRVGGRGQGVLYVGERTFWSDTRWATYRMGGGFLIRHPYHYPESGGGDVVVTVGRGGGEARIDWVALVSPGDPIDPLRVPEADP